MSDDSRVYKTPKEKLPKLAAYNRKSYQKKIKKLLDLQVDPTHADYVAVEKFVKNRMLRGAKFRAVRDNLEFAITAADIVLPAVCPISLQPLRLAAHGKDKRASFSLDRLDNTKGYTKDNIRVISNEANVTKGAQDVAFFERLIAYMKGQL